MEMTAEKYEAPEVVTFGELDFEPTQGTVHCSTLVNCSGQTGHCTSVVTIGP